jgi:uncharacterized membrane protein YccC
MQTNFKRRLIMNASRLATRLLALIRVELHHLAAIQSSDRAWQMPFAAALASGLPLLAGAAFNRMDDGLVASLGGLVFIYMPNTPLSHRMVSVMASAFGMIACYALGLASQLFPPLMVPVLAFITILVGLLALGCLQACLIGFFYSVHILRLQAPKPVPPLAPPTFDFVVFDSVVIGVFVAISLAAAQALQLQKAYWVPVSCLAVIQGMSLRAVWNRQLQRVLGTGVGLLAAWGLLQLPLQNWGIALVMMALSVAIESTVTRHYAIATIFITPLTILLADAATLGHYTPAALLQARFFDTVLGCLIGLAGGASLHSTRFREVAGRLLRRMIPRSSV